MTKFGHDQVMARVTTLTDGDNGGQAWRAHLPKADLVVEAVPEDLAVKHAVIKAAEDAGMRDDAVFATNTSALPIADIARGSAHPERVVGMHYFSPVPKMPLLEVIPHAGTADEAAAAAAQAAQAEEAAQRAAIAAENAATSLNKNESVSILTEEEKTTTWTAESDSDEDSDEAEQRAMMSMMQTIAPDDRHVHAFTEAGDVDDLGI